MLRCFFVMTTLLYIQNYSMADNKLIYTVSFENVNSHYVDVEILIPAAKTNEVYFKVPVWTPGSYKVREFSNAFEWVHSEIGRAERVNKNTWKVLVNRKQPTKIQYKVYCFVESVRQSYANQFYAFLHGVSVFGYIEGFEKHPIEIDFNLSKEWNNIETSLAPEGKSGKMFSAENYDELVDSPIALGNFESSTYESGGCPHKIVMIGDGNYKLDTFTEDLKKISDFYVHWFKGHPSPRYVHFIYNVEDGGGGLEHANSQTSMMRKWSYNNPSSYQNLLRLVAHEYFHLWNVKRIRPIKLGPFDYNNEVYTDMLWIAEGITSYIDQWTMFKLGYVSREGYLSSLASRISSVERTEGKNVMTLAESSLLAWVKGYLPNEESNNTSISYYSHGSLVALLLDLELRQKNTSIQELLLFLFEEYYQKRDRGFTHQEFIDACNRLSGSSFDDFFKKYVFGLDPLPYAETFGKVGIEVRLVFETLKKYLGVQSATENGNIVVKFVAANSPAAKAGISVNDEIISVNNLRITSNIESELTNITNNDEIEITLSRQGKLFTTKLTLIQNPYPTYLLDIKDSINSILKKWLN